MSNCTFRVRKIEDALNYFIRKRDSPEIRKLKTRFLEGFLKFLGDYQKQVECTNHIFMLFQENPTDETISRKALFYQCEKMGILKDDPRIGKMVEHLDENCTENINVMDLTIALSGVGVKANPHIQFILQVMTSDLLIAEFGEFKSVIKDLFDQC